MLKVILTSKRYWKTTLFLALGFMVVFSLIEHFMSYRALAIDSFLEDKIEEGRWIRFLISRIVGGLIYGMIMGYYFESKKQKSNQ
ncbi:hypothetical protein [Aquimarina pacifica]|uniref:hypothetical protein n=1 Tax=Aquimarina pacifica TaxID=1296415 RepID=UPI00047202C1|nr:hypothetical protein [Aquimarina pacifica]